MANYQEKYTETAKTILQLITKIKSITDLSAEDKKAAVEIIAFNMKRSNDDLINKIADMRRLQKNYFKSRSPVELQWAKNAEKEIDKIINDFNNPKLF